MAEMGIIDVSLVFSTPAGMLECEDEVNGYWLHADTFNQSVGAHRNTTVANRWVEGTYAVSTVRDNTTESVVVYVRGATQGQYRARMEALKAVFDQPSFTGIKTIGSSIEQWDCMVSDYTEESQQEYIHRTMGDLRVSLQRRPQVTVKTVNPQLLPTEWWTTLAIGATLGELPVGPFALGTPARPFYLEDIDV